MNKFFDIQRLTYARKEGIHALKHAAANNSLLHRIFMRGIVERWQAINSPDIAGKRLTRSNRSLYGRYV